MADTIQVQYEELTQIQRKFNQLSDDVSQVSKNLSNKVETLRDDGWQGRGSDAFYNEVSDEVMPAIKRLLQALNRAGVTTNQIASTFNEAEETTRK